jgi:crotonobetainyl-CoA:carnitine CoA-transferase CaiB-like acyl-CoA transferase
VRRKLKTEPEDVFAINPKVVFARGHGQGQRGPDAEAGGFDSVSFWTRGSVAHLLTEPDAAAPIMQRPAQGDVPTGMFLAGGVCAALVHAQRTGKGVLVDTSLLNGAVWTLGPDMAYASLAGREAPRRSASPPRSPLVSTHRTADGRWMQLNMLDDDRYFAPTCRALGVPELTERYPDDGARRPAWTEIGEQFGKIIAGLTWAEVSRRLREQGCIFSLYASPPEVVQDPAVVDNGYLMPHPTHGPLRLSAAPAQFDNELPAIRREGPALGEHTREVLTELGYAPGQVEELAASGAVVVA